MRQEIQDLSSFAMLKKSTINHLINNKKKTKTKTMKKAILTFGAFFTMVVLTSFNEPKTEKVTISKTTTEIGGGGQVVDKPNKK
jgi:hypothetical protein